MAGLGSTWCLVVLSLVLLLGGVRGARNGALRSGGGREESELGIQGHKLPQRHLMSKSKSNSCGDSKDAAKGLEEALNAGNLLCVKRALKAGADPSEPSMGFSMGTALHLAATNGNLKIVKVLLKAKADVNARDRFLATPLHSAAGNGFVRIVKALLRAGAEISAINSDESTALHTSARNGHPEVIKVLVVNGAEIDNVDGGGDTALHQAAESGHIEAVKTLLDLGADKSIPDEGGATAGEEICEDAPSCPEEVKQILKSLLS